ncbi:hypothetical protein TRVL_03467 [Trypanosoma vivax]|nr:hypothetical protein TRVL_03467 [Trypanosoma vivax]
MGLEGCGANSLTSSLRIRRATSFGERPQGNPNRPSRSRLLNLNSLRPQGVVTEAELVDHLRTELPSDTLLSDIVTAVNDSQSRMHRQPDFVITADTKDAMGSLHSKAFRHWWINKLAEECASVEKYPYTKLRFLAPYSRAHSADSVSTCEKEADTTACVADLIRRILLVFAKVSNNGNRVYENLLFHTLRNEKGSVRELLLANYDSRHIVVCCGLYFYRVDVLDECGTVLSEEVISKSLQQVREHAERTEQMLHEQTLLPDVKEDMVSFCYLLGRLTEIDRNDCAAIMERMRGANEVNDIALSSMDAAIFSVILHVPWGGSSKARWFRSALVLEEEAASKVFSMRAHAVVLGRAAFMEFVRGTLNWKHEDAVYSNPQYYMRNTEGSSPDDLSHPQCFEHLNMWLPWKHRKPMQPYAEKQPSPSVLPLELSLPVANFTPFTCLCLSVVIAVQELLTPDHAFPTVLVAFPHVRGGVSAALLYSKEVEACIQCLRSGSALIERRTIRHEVVTALDALGDIISACYEEHYPLYSMAELLLSQGKATSGDATKDGGMLGMVDVCISFDQLDAIADVSQSETSLVLPSRFSVMSNGRRARSGLQREVNAKKPWTSHLTCAFLMQHHSLTELTSGSELARCISEKTRQLSSLLLS